MLAVMLVAVASAELVELSAEPLAHTVAGIPVMLFGAMVSPAEFLP
jgi:hypothetical protein